MAFKGVATLDVGSSKIVATLSERGVNIYHYDPLQTLLTIFESTSFPQGCLCISK